MLCKVRMIFLENSEDQIVKTDACAISDWLSHQPEYKHLTVGTTIPKSSTSTFMSNELHSQTLNRFIDAAKIGVSKSQTGFDPDVQIGLGILFNLSADYEKAADCFKAALSVRPEDAMLWNKLGATLGLTF